MLSDRLVITTGTLQPVINPPAIASIKFTIILTSEFPVSIFGTNKTFAFPATLFERPLILAAYVEIELSNANGP